jgi:NADP-dependent aldehyde dehydrogenase
MQLTGEHLIGYSKSAESASRFRATNPATRQAIGPEYHDATELEIERAAALAEACFDSYRQSSPDEIAGFLNAIGDEIDAVGDDLTKQAQLETGLPSARLSGERARTVNQARLFAELVEEGSWIDARIDLAAPERKPLPKPDVRRMLMPIGPVVVFGASNFPLAISVAGSDTVSALAAGCPVIVKAHPAHPGTSELVARAILEAARKTGIPEGVFSLLHGASNAVGDALVRHPKIQAVAFTGSLRGGRALFDAAAERPRPIPVYAEMGSTNPIFLLQGALEASAAEIAQGFVQSVTLGVGQFCTNPGLVFAVQGGPLETFVTEAARAASGVAPATMLHAGIRTAFEAGIQRIQATTGVSVAGRSSGFTDSANSEVGCVLFVTDLDGFEQHPYLAEEVFGPTSIVVRCPSAADLDRVAEGLEGHLTATLHGTAADLKRHASLVRKLERKVGRLIFNGFPTGIEVCAAMHHGGPYPATTDSHFTSIGTASILRFARPVCYQNFPDAALPEALKNENPRRRHRLVDNRLTQEDI